MEKVFTGREVLRAMRPTTALESTPPERNAPSGTSATRRRRTASSNSARSSQLASARVPDGEGEHAAKVFDAGRAALLVCVDDCFGVRASLKNVAASFEFGLQLAVVVNLAIEDDCDLPVFARHRLVPAR